MGIIKKSGGGHPASGVQHSLVTGKQFGELSRVGIDGEPGIPGTAATGPVLHALHDDPGVGPTRHLFRKADRCDPTVEDAVGYPQTPDLDVSLMFAGGIGGLIDAPSPVGPRGGDLKAVQRVTEITGAGQRWSSPLADQLSSSRE